MCRRMSSWGSYTPPPRLGYYQELPLGTFVKKEGEVGTVVSAYYQLRTKKWTNEQYKSWIEQFLSIPCHLIFFTSQDLEPWISSCRSKFTDKTKIIILLEEEWTSSKRFAPDFWQKQNQLDPEKNIHFPELYKIWYEKKEFVKRAIEINPWNHTDFVWTDAGLCRESKLVPYLQSYPYVERIPIDRFLIMNTSPFTRNDENKLIVSKDRIGGGVLAASLKLWKWFIEEYDKVIQEYINKNLFCGIDQHVMASLVIKNKNKISLLDAKPISINKWFYLFHYLGFHNILYSIMRNPKLNKQSNKLEDYIKVLSNIKTE